MRSIFNPPAAHKDFPLKLLSGINNKPIPDFLKTPEDIRALDGK